MGATGQAKPALRSSAPSPRRGPRTGCTPSPRGRTSSTTSLGGGCSSATTTSTRPGRSSASGAWHARLDRAAARHRPWRPALPPAQGGSGVGARAVPPAQPVLQQRPARGRGPAADAGRERHHARLGTDGVDGRALTRLLRSPAVRCEGVGAGRGDGSQGPPRLRADVRLGARAGARTLRRCDCDRRDLGSGMSFDEALVSFAEGMPTRTSGITGPSELRSTQVAWSRRSASERREAWCPAALGRFPRWPWISRRGARRSSRRPAQATAAALSPRSPRRSSRRRRASSAPPGVCTTTGPRAKAAAAPAAAGA